MAKIQVAKTIVNSRSGFSLIELMVSVGIIGVLATVAVPQYSKFTNKAKQSEAKSLLGGIYMTEKTFFVEKSSYSACLAEMGFSADASNTRKYAVGFRLAHKFQGGATCDPANAAGAKDVIQFLPATDNTGAVDAQIPSVLPTATTFTAGASGNLGVATHDKWTINELQSITNSQLGI